MSFMQMYKPGQGKWARGLSAAGIGIVVAFGIYWLLEELRGFVTSNAEFILGGVALVVIAGFGALAWWLLNKPRIVEFMIATESEMRKVNWPTRKEIIGSTWVVVLGTLLIAFTLFVVDLGFTWFFTWIKIIDINL